MKSHKHFNIFLAKKNKTIRAGGLMYCIYIWNFCSYAIDASGIVFLASCHVMIGLVRPAPYTGGGGDSLIPCKF